MGLNDTPSGERLHIGFFGLRNAGKSSVVNAVTGQDLSVVSPVLGTTTDPVSKAMELLPLGPVKIVDTPGYDDSGELGELRVKKTRAVLNRSDMAILVTSVESPMGRVEDELIGLFKERGIPWIVVHNKSDILDSVPANAPNEAWVSAKTGQGIEELKEMMSRLVVVEQERLHVIGDLLAPKDLVLLVIPIDKAAPKGRLILPQQQVIRDVLEAQARCIITNEHDVAETIAKLGIKPKMVVTDSQAFKTVSEQTPSDILLTSFSILLARYKGYLEGAVRGVAAVESLKDGDRILMAEGCTHHRQCTDIGTVKIPRWIEKYTGKKLVFETSSGNGFPEDLTPYALVVNCGGCMLPAREIRYRMRCLEEQGVPYTNYGVLIAETQGILRRSLEVLPDIAKLLA